MYELVMNEDGNVKLQDGKPVYKDKDGKEISVDVPTMYQKIIDLGRENKQHREKGEALSSKFKIFEGIEDLEDWKTNAEKAMETVANFNEKDWLKAEKVESMKRQMKEAHDKEIEQVTESFKQKENDYSGKLLKKDEQIRRLMISAEFAKSPLFSGNEPKTTLTPDFAESFFGKNFKIEEGNGDGELVVRAYYSNGDLIYSRSNPGEPATFVEGMEEIWDKYPGRKKFMRAKSGTGSSGGNDGDVGDENSLANLQKRYKEAVDNKNPALAIQLKNQIHELQMQQRQR